MPCIDNGFPWNGWEGGGRSQKTSTVYMYIYWQELSFVSDGFLYVLVNSGWGIGRKKFNFDLCWLCLPNMPINHVHCFCYNLQINILQSRRRIDVLDTVSCYIFVCDWLPVDGWFSSWCDLSFCSCFQILKFMHAQSTYFHQGYDLMNDLDQYMKNVSSEVRKTLLQKQILSKSNYK